MKINQDKIKKMSVLLEKENYLYSRLLKISENIQDTVVKNDMEHLSKLVETEDSIFTQAEKLRQERMDVMLAVKNDLGLSDEEYGLGKLMEFMDEKEASELNKLRDNLLENINKLDSLNRNNHILVDYSMNLNAKFMNLLVNLGQNNTIYRQSGKVQSGDNVKRRILDRKI